MKESRLKSAKIDSMKNDSSLDSENKWFSLAEGKRGKKRLEWKMLSKFQQVIFEKHFSTPLML